MSTIRRLHRFTQMGVALLALAGVQTFGQTNTPPTNAPTDANAELKSRAIAFAQGVESNKSIYVAVHPEFAPNITVNGKAEHFGVGVALLTEADAIPALQGTVVGTHVFGGLRFDYLAHQAFASTIGVGLKGDMQLWGHNFTGFVEGGGNIPFSGFGQQNGDLGGMFGTGGYTSLWSPSPNVHIAVQVTGERWTQFPGWVFLGGPVVHITF